MVTSTILGLVQNFKSFGGILVVSPGALVVAWVGWLCGVQVACGWPNSALMRRPTAMSGCQTCLAPSFQRGLGVAVYARVFVVTTQSFVTPESCTTVKNSGNCEQPF